MNEPLIFVSCGQSTPAERQLGREIVNLVEKETNCRAYFAQNQTNLEGVTENILKKLLDAAGFIAIMHPRGNVSNPSDPTKPHWVRGSVWVEQEIAIAAFISQALERPMHVRAYVHESILREGLRDKLHLNPVPFQTDAYVLQDLTSFLPSWSSLGEHRRKEPLSVKANIHHQRQPIPGGSNDPLDERHMLLVGIENDGEQDASDFRLDVEIPGFIVDGSGYSIEKPSRKPGTKLFQVKSEERGIKHLYPSEQIPDLITGVYYWVSGKIKRESPELLEQKVVATVFSGNMKPKSTSKRIAELLD